MEASNKKGLYLWSSVAAAAAGIAVVVAMVWWKRSEHDTEATTRLRDVQDVLEDCQRKIHEIETSIPAV